MSRDRSELERRLTERATPELWAVYADLLLLSQDAQDRQFGELLALELAGKLEKEARDRAAAAWFGEVPEFGSWDDVEVDENGDFEPPTTHPVPFLGVTGQLQLSWWGPYVVEAQIKQGGELEYNDSGCSFPLYEGVSAQNLLEALVASPAARFLRALTVEAGLDRGSMVGLAGVPESLRVLHIGALEAGNAAWCGGGDLSELPFRTPFLEQLRVWAHGTSCVLSPKAPYLELKRLVLVLVEPYEDQLDLFYPELFPALETLQLSFSWGSYWRDNWMMVRQEQSLEFLSRDFPNLKHLALHNFPDAITMLLKSPILPQLLSLELTDLSTDMLRQIADNDEAFLHIPDFWLGYDSKDEALLARLPWHIRVSQPDSWRFSPE